MKFVKSIALVLFLNLGINCLYAQNSNAFYANASSSKVIEGGNFTVEFVMNNISGNAFKAPNFDNFQVISGPSRSSSYSNINGQVSQELKYSFVLRPLEVGTFTIGAAYCSYNGKRLATVPFNIEVQKSLGSVASLNVGLYVWDQNINFYWMYVHLKIKSLTLIMV